jgi:fructose-bisphosphate aldolase class II
MGILLAHARKQGYAVPAYTVDMWSMETAALAAEEEDSPLILMGWEGDLKCGDIRHWAALARAVARDSRVPMAVHLDHGTSFEICIEAIRCGFTSVMIDASTKSYGHNVAVTRKVVEAAHAVGVTVEAELGHVGQGSEKLTGSDAEQLMTDPEQAARFVWETRVDALAVAIGNLHGLYKYEPRLDLDRLSEIVQKTDAFIVLHGGSGTPNRPETVARGVTKINLAADFQVAFRDHLDLVKSNTPATPRYVASVLKPATDAVKGVMQDRIRELGSHGQASAFRRGP